VNLTLLLMVRNEEKTIESTLDSALACADHVVIVDTGSTDHTIALAKLKLESWCGPTWEIHQREWVDYSWNRNEALGLAAEPYKKRYANGQPWDVYEPDWIFMLDADCKLHGAIDLRIYLGALELMAEKIPELKRVQAFNILVKSGVRNVDQTRVFKPGSDWRYVGVVHEVAVSPTKPSTLFSKHPIPGVLIEHMGTDLADKPRQWAEHARLLELEVKKKPQDMRSWFYLGQSYELLERADEAFEAYHHCWVGHGFWEERWEAGLRMSSYLFDKDDWKGCVVLLQELVKIKPWRVEGWYWLARSMAELKAWHNAYCAALFGHVLPLPDHDHYFIQPEFYGVKSTLLWMVTCLYSGHAEDAIATYDMISDRLTPAERIFFNQQRELTNHGGQKESRSETEESKAQGNGARGDLGAPGGKAAIPERENAGG